MLLLLESSNDQGSDEFGQRLNTNVEFLLISLAQIIAHRLDLKVSKSGSSKSSAVC